MLKFIICGLIFSITTDVECKFNYEYHPMIYGWLNLHKFPATWMEAFTQCQKEGAVLASPLTEEMMNEMKILIDYNRNSETYLGTHAIFSPGQFVSLEGVPLDNMPITDFLPLSQLEGSGECLSIDGRKMTVVPCTKRLPFICYKKYEAGTKLTQCGTFDKEYRFDAITGSCYKAHLEARSWTDANLICMSEGGHLVILNDVYEANLIKSLANFPWTSKWVPLHTGIKDWTGQGAGTWMSIHGEPLDQLYKNWAAGQPDATGQLCGGLLSDLSFDNIYCNHKTFFVCEKKPEHTESSTNLNLLRLLPK